MANAARPEPPPLARRFYQAVTVERTEAGFRPLLDGRPVRTPARNVLAVPHAPIAEAIAAEWRVQENVIRPATMPATRLANSAIDGVAARRDAVAGDIAAFALTDLLCYRAERPEALAERQRALWDPILAHAEARLGVRFVLAAGVMPVEQDPAVGAAVRAALPADPFALAGLHVLTTLTGSALIALAVRDAFLSPEAAWEAAHVDEDWNISLWGEDAEAAARRAARWREAEAAALFILSAR